MNKAKIIKNTLKFKYKHSRNIGFWLEDENLVPLTLSSLSIIDKYDRGVLPDNIEVVKNTPVNKRLLFRIDCPYTTQKTIIVKALNLHMLRLRFKYCWMKYHRYGFSETANIIVARERGIKLPKVYGYGQVYNSFGLIKKDIVFLEDLGNHIPINELLDQNKDNSQKCVDILDSVIPLLITHYKARCNNWDINTGSIVFDQKSPILEAKNLDFEYIVFNKKPSLEVLMFLAARLVWHIIYASPWIGNEIFSPWINRLIEAAGIKDTAIRKQLTERFHYHLAKDYIPHRERMKVC